MCLLVEFLVHKEIDDEHDQGDHEKHNAESHRASHADIAPKFREHRRENHTGGHTQTRQGHLRTHRKSHLAPLEPFYDTAAHGNAGHLHSAAKDHEAYGREFGGSGHPFIERGDAKLVEHRDIVKVICEPYIERAAAESVSQGIPVDGGAHEHHGT